MALFNFLCVLLAFIYNICCLEHLQQHFPNSLTLIRPSISVSPLHFTNVIVYNIFVNMTAFTNRQVEAPYWVPPFIASGSKSTREWGASYSVCGQIKEIYFGKFILVLLVLAHAWVNSPMIPTHSIYEPAFVNIDPWWRPEVHITAVWILFWTENWTMKDVSRVTGVTC